MPARTDALDLVSLRLSAGEGRRLDPGVAIKPFLFGDQQYPVTPSPLPAVLDISRTTGAGYVLRLRFQATLTGPCMRCLGTAEPVFDVDAREVSQPGEIDELDSPYVADQVLDLQAWARDALALLIPAGIVCRENCAGLCPQCGVDLNQAGPEHGHETPPDPRWSKLSELRLD